MPYQIRTIIDFTILACMLVVVIGSIATAMLPKPPRGS